MKSDNDNKDEMSRAAKAFIDEALILQQRLEELQANFDRLNDVANRLDKQKDDEA